MALNFVVDVDGSRYLRVTGKKMTNPTNGVETYRLGLMLCLKAYYTDDKVRAPYINMFFNDEQAALDFLERMYGAVDNVLNLVEEKVEHDPNEFDDVFDEE